MTYRLLQYTFTSQGEYEAALRDQRRIRSLRREGTTKEEVAENYLEQIHRFHIAFESPLGEDFLASIRDNAPSYDTGAADAAEANKAKPDAGGRAKKTRTRSIRLPFSKARRRMLLAAYSAVGVFLVFVFVWGYRTLESESNLRKLQYAMHAREYLKEEENEILPKLSQLHEQNPDLAGWLSIPDTPIDYPVMYRSDDNDFYLSHNMDKEEDVAGLLVLDKRCDPEGNGINDLIHGHNMKSGRLFGSLDQYASEEYYRQHPLIYFSTLYEDRVYEIIAVFKSTVYDDDTEDVQYFNYIQIDTTEQFNTYVGEAKSSSLYDTGRDASWGDVLITLSTCEYSKKNGRLVVLGRRIK